MRLQTALACLLVAAPAVGQNADTTAKIRAALGSEIRTEQERARDEERKPLDVLTFMRLEDDMRVIEILPASGWYTKILGQVLRDDGKLYVTHPSPTFYSNAFAGITDLPGLDRIEEIGWGAETQGGSPFFASGEWAVEPVDMVLTFRNYHNFSVESRIAVNESAFDALKPGGYYGIVDHTRRHMEPSNDQNGRRMDPVLVIKEVEASGFDFVDFTDALRSPVDELLYEVGRPNVTGRTDRFTLLFQKPAE
jgi:predicted methyltransferase